MCANRVPTKVLCSSRRLWCLPQVACSHALPPPAPPTHHRRCDSMPTCHSPPKPPGPVACIPPWRGRGRSRRIASNQPYTHRLKSHWVNGHKQVTLRTAVSSFSRAPRVRTRPGHRPGYGGRMVGRSEPTFRRMRRRITATKRGHISSNREKKLLLPSPEP